MIQQHIINGLTFHSEDHRYEYNGKELQGITSLINRYIFPDKYAGVSEVVLEQAAQRGKKVHEDIEQHYEAIRKGEQPFFVAPAVERFHTMLRITMLKVIDNEVLVMSEVYGRATAIDLVLEDTEGGIILGDIKTTYAYDDLYLRWQLSIEAKMYERCFGKKVVGLVGVWMPNKGEGGIREVERLPDNEVVRLLSAGAMDVQEFKTEFKPMQDEVMPEVLLEQAEQINHLTRQIEALTFEREALMREITTAFLASPAKSWEGAGCKFSRVKGGERKSFDHARLRKEHAELADLFAEYEVTKTTEDTVRFKLME